VSADAEKGPSRDELLDALHPVLEAIDIPHAATTSEPETRDAIFVERTGHVTVMLRSLLAEDSWADWKWSTAYLRERMAEHPTAASTRPGTSAWPSFRPPARPALRAQRCPVRTTQKEDRMRGMCGFGLVQPLPGITDWHLNTAITLPVGVESYGAYALGAWLFPGTSATVRKPCARPSRPGTRCPSASFRRASS
jgi:hypothetical protein